MRDHHRRSRHHDLRYRRLQNEEGALPDLLCLSLADTGLRELPPSFGPLPQLSVLDLGHNPLTEIPAALAALPRLEVLSLDACPIEAHAWPLPPDGPLRAVWLPYAYRGPTPERDQRLDGNEWVDRFAFDEYARI